IQGTRVLADSLGRVAEMETRLFHFYVHERLRASGLSGRALMDAVDAAGDQATPLVEPMVLYFHRLGWQRAFREALVDHIAADAAALEIDTRTASEPQFPAVRTGIHCGTVLYREGDYVGSNVNIASRLASEAERHQILVTAEVRKEARDLPDVEFVRIGKRKL